MLETIADSDDDTPPPPKGTPNRVKEALAKKREAKAKPETKAPEPAPAKPTASLAAILSDISDAEKVHDLNAVWMRIVDIDDPEQRKQAEAAAEARGKELGA